MVVDTFAFIYSPERFISLKKCYEYALSLNVPFVVVSEGIGFTVKCLKSFCGVKW